jgi:ribulose-5-phosphate 4-epimerase/fuculose-1-phosphate aldolase
MPNAVPTEQDTSDAVRHAREDLAAAHRLMVTEDLHEGTWNHLSVTVPGDPSRVFITPGLKHWSQVRASDLTTVGPDEDVEQMKRDNGHLWVGYRIHYPLHQARPDAVCVIHAHSPYATAMSMVDGARLEPAEQNALHFHGRIAYNDEYDSGVPNVGFEQGRTMAEALGDRAIVLFLRNHGVVVVGPSVGHAFSSLYLLERACRTYWLAQGLGRPLTMIPEHRRTPGGDDFKDEHFAALRRVLDDTQPDYVD